MLWFGNARHQAVLGRTKTTHTQIIAGLDKLLIVGPADKLVKYINTQNIYSRLKKVSTLESVKHR